MKLSRSLKIAAAAAAVTLFAAQPAFAGVTINGGGSSFAAPLINTCKIAWQTQNSATVNYATSSSGTGRKNADNGIGAFNFSDASYTPLKSTIIHIPVVAAPVSIAYNIPGVSSDKPLYLSQKSLSDIFAGKVTKWNDAEIVADNAGTKASVVYKKDAKGATVKVNGKPVVLKTVKATSRISLPNQDIRVVFRADTSGTTQNLANFFIAQFPAVWTNASNSAFTSVFPGAGIPISFLSATGSSGVAALAASTPYSITYVEHAYAASNKLGEASIQNASGNFQGPTAAGTAAFLNSATAAANGALTFNYGTKEAGAYVLGIVSYALVDTADTGDWAAAATSFIKYVASDACVNTDPTLGYSTITGSLKTINDRLIAKLATN